MNGRITYALVAGAALLGGCDVETTEAVGTVRTAEGAPIAGAELRLWTIYRPDARPEARTRSDGEGRFRIAFSNTCGFVDCAFSGDLVADADGYEGVIADVPAGKGNRVDVTLRPDDGLPVEANGIPEETPRPLLEATTVREFSPSVPDPTPWRAEVRRGVPGDCDAWVVAFGRDDQLACTDASGRDLGPCFVGDDGAGPVVCHPDGLRGRHWAELEPDTALPAGRPAGSVPDALPLTVGIPTDYRARHVVPVGCFPPAVPLVTNLGEPIAYECTGGRVTWLLDDLEPGTLWTVTRVGSAVEVPDGGVVEVLGRETVLLSSVLR